MLEALIDGWWLFNETWIAWLRLPLWLVVPSVIWICMVARVVRVLMGDKLELVRRRRLLARLRHNIPAARSEVHGMLNRARRACVELRVERWVAGHPISMLLEQDGIGQGTIAHLRTAGFATLGDVMLRAPRARQVGPVRMHAIQRFVQELLERRVQRAVADPATLPPDPEMEALLEQVEDIIRARGLELDADLARLVTLEETIQAFERVCRDTTGMQRLSAWIESWTQPRRDRLISFAGAVLAGVMLPALLPLPIAMAFPGLAVDAVAVSYAILVVGPLLLAMSHFVLADAGYSLGWQLPSPGSFMQQRLEAASTRMALELGIAPPDVYIEPNQDPNAWTIGRSTGPSIVVVSQGLLNSTEFSPRQVEAVIAHELGHLAGDDTRLAASTRRLLGPLRWIGEPAIAVALELAVRAFWIPRWQSFGIQLATVFWFPVLVIWLVATGPLVALTLVSQQLTGLVSQRKEFDADAVAARLAGVEHIQGALEALEAHAQAEGRPPSVSPMQLLMTVHCLSPKQRLQLVVRHTVARLAGSHPPFEARVRALHQPLSIEAHVSLALARAVAFVVVPVLILGFAMRSTAARVSSIGEGLATSAPVTEAASGSSGEVWTNVGACTLRDGGSMEHRAISYPENGTCCDLDDPDGSWSRVRCEGHPPGWMHNSCVRQVSNTPCRSR